MYAGGRRAGRINSPLSRSTRLVSDSIYIDCGVDYIDSGRIGPKVAR